MKDVMKEQLKGLWIKDLWIVAVTVIFLSILLFVLPLYAQTYTMTDLSPFHPYAVASPFLVGEEGGQPVRLDLRTGQKQILQNLRFGGVAQDVLPTGVAVGWVNNGQSDLATFWDEDGAFYLIPGTNPSSAQSVNHNWTTAGTGNCGGQQVPTRWFPSLGTNECLGAAMQGVVRIDGGDFVWTTINGRVAVFGINGAVFDLGTGKFRAVNEQGTAAITQVTNGADQVYKGSLTEPWTLLPRVVSLNCEARAINNLGVIVGGCGGAPVAIPVMWMADGSGVDLSHVVTWPEGTSEIVVMDIDDAGLLLVQVWRPFVTGSLRYNVLLTPDTTQPVAKNCGGDIPCACGDTVVQSYTLPADLTCPVQGFEAALVLTNGVTLNGNNHALVGIGGGTGILMDQTQGARVAGLRLAGFTAGVKLRAGANANTIAMTQGSTSQTALLLDNANRNTVLVSGWYNDAGVGVVLQNSHGNRFLANCIQDGSIQLTNSDDNVWRGTATQCPVIPQSTVASR